RLLRYLHSLPTRRSSDLSGLGVAAYAAFWILVPAPETPEDAAGRRRGRDWGQLLAYVAVTLGLAVLPWGAAGIVQWAFWPFVLRSEEHTSELQSRENLVC